MSHSKTPPTLAAWIEIATSGLPASVQVRLKGEIEDHYANLIHQQLAEGQSQQQAETLALQQLGAADQVSQEYRDAHFSRDRYSKTMWAVITLLAIQTITFLGNTIERVIERFDDYGYRFIYIVRYLQPWNTLASILSIILIVIIGRGVLTLWKERYGVEVSRIIYWLFIVGVFGSIWGMAFYSALGCIACYLVSDSQLTALDATPLWQAIVSVTAFVGGLATVMLGISLLMFVFTT